MIFANPDMSSQLERALHGFNASTRQPTGSIPITHTLDHFGTSAIVSSDGSDGLAYRTGSSPVYDHPNNRDHVILIRTGAIQ